MTQTGAKRRPARLPSFLVGVATAVSAEVSVAVLLYGGPGFTRSLTTSLAVGAGALATGLWFGGAGSDPVAGLRGRWLLALSSFLIATAFATLWTLVPAVGDGRLGQGAGLAALAGLPLYACGSVLAGLASRARSSGAGGARPVVAATATYGAASGFVVTGLMLPRAPMPASLLVGCLVLLSLAAMVDAASADEEVEGPEEDLAAGGPNEAEEGSSLVDGSPR